MNESEYQHCYKDDNDKQAAAAQRSFGAARHTCLLAIASSLFLVKRIIQPIVFFFVTTKSHAAPLFIDLEDSHECFLGNLDVADILHALLALLLLFEELTLTRDIAAIALC